MLALVIAGSLITTPAPAGRPEAECIREYPGQWAKIADCIAPPIDLDKNPKFKRAVQACKAAQQAASNEGATMRRATIIVDGIETECTGD